MNKTGIHVEGMIVTTYDISDNEHMNCDYIQPGNRSRKESGSTPPQSLSR